MAHDSHVRFLTTPDGVSVLVREFVPKSPAWGALLLVHGIGEHSGRYQHVGAFFAESGLRVVAFDHRGHGASSGQRAHVQHFEEYLADVALHMEGLHGAAGDSPVFLFGHSLGGLIAARYALDHVAPMPDKLVLSAPALAAATPGWQRALAPVLSRVVPRWSFAAPVALDQLSTDPAIGRAYHRDPLVIRTATARLGQQIFEAMGAAQERLSQLKVPTLVIHGGDDTLVPTRATEVIGTLPTVTRKVYPGVRHELHNAPEQAQVLGDVLAFLKGEQVSDG